MLDINLLQLRIKELEQMEYGLSMALDIEMDLRKNAENQVDSLLDEMKEDSYYDD